MSRDIRRVPLDFDWPLGEVWGGYVMPDELLGQRCTACEIGYSPEAQHLHDLWYGKVPFRPEDRGSTPFAYSHPVIWAQAERHVAESAWFYGSGPLALMREARRLADFYNNAWSHHLNQDDVDALIAGGRLMDFTHTYTRGEGWVKKDPAPVVTAAEVNEWSLSGFGHGSSNCWIVVRARCEREGIELACSTCEGSATRWRDDAHRQAHDAWERTDPPAGEGWQVWESVSEGSPITPVFATAEALIDYLATVGYGGRWGEDGPLSREAATAMVTNGWVPSGFGGPTTGFISGDRGARLLYGTPEED